MKRVKYALELLAIVLLAAISAVNYAVFIFPNHFAPAGLDGLCTMFQDLTGINIGYSALILNIPLLIAAYIGLNKDFAIKNIVFILSFSVVSAVLDQVDLSAFYYQTESNTSIVLAPVAAGVIRGILYAITLGLNGSSGGVDIVAALIRKKHPHFNLMNIIFAINIGVAVCSYFVYGNHLEPVICGILYFYITSQTSSGIQLSRKENAKIEIITQNAADLCAGITQQLHLSATTLQSHGAYSQNDNTMVVCIAPKKQLPPVIDLLKQFPDAIYFISTVNESNIHNYKKA